MSENIGQFKMLSSDGKLRKTIVCLEIAMQRPIHTYRKKCYFEVWIIQGMRTIETRKEMTVEWEGVAVNEGIEYASLTEDISKS